jgi:cellulose synthase operon protein C
MGQRLIVAFVTSGGYLLGWTNQDLAAEEPPGELAMKTTMERKSYTPARALIAGLVVIFGLAALYPARTHPATDPKTNVSTPAQILTVASGQRKSMMLGDVKAGETYRLLIALAGTPASPADRIRIELAGAGSDRFTKELHAGDPDFYLPYRPSVDGRVTLALASLPGSGASARSVRVDWTQLPLEKADSAAIEAEPNDSWQQANELRLGRDVHGSADDVDYLDNLSEGRSGLDWFRFEVVDEKPVLVYFQLDLLDRDVSSNLRVYTMDSKTGRPQPYLRGKDPMEIVHDRERERYSKHISRTFSRGTYYLEVNANHPDYILRTRVLPLPPYDEPSRAVEAGMHYIMNVGDAWFAQIPREGNIYVRSNNLHDTATRCTACHPSSFSTEANLVAHRNGYPIRSKSSFQYVIDRLYNSITPLYGDQGLYWQRFIAIPLQSQGKQGGILLDYERQISHRETKTVERFGPFLRRAWESRNDLPPDEQNGVLPLDSKFGFAWRDLRVLKELGERTGDVGYTKAATRIGAILGERAADRRMETLQDRIHRLYAWSLIDKAAFENKIKRETGALLLRQNADGGWHHSNDGPGPSAVYTTGQLVYTLLRIGLPRDHPAIARALRYLMSQQQEFGGWMQTTTDENFRTPMRETRYAVMALAEAYPRPGAPGRGWGNRDDGPAHLPRTDSLIHTLDDLENLWDVPRSDQERFEKAIVALLDHREPVIRATAAACLGRLGQSGSVAPLVDRLRDPSKIVWRSAAWALRRLGNQGIGHDAILSALKSPDPATRRGATRIFAYQFHGMDERLELAEPLFELTRDPDLWTRLQALRSLRQWFYRTKDPTFARRIVDTYLVRMSQDNADLVRRNLSEGLYIMLDENLGGGVSLQKNLGELPEAMRSPILDARKAFERDVLLTPILTALRQGDGLQRAGVLAAFDGSFFKGRVYARQPSGMIDVGNDREFGFLHEPRLNELEATFLPLLTADLPPESRRQVIQLASFFRLTSQSRSPVIQKALLRRLGDPDERVAGAARKVVSDELDLTLAGFDAELTGTIISAMEGSPAEVEAIVNLIGRTERLSARPEVIAAIRRLKDREEIAPSLLPILHWPLFREPEVVSIILHSWPKLSQPRRLIAIEVLLARPDLVDVVNPREQVMQILRRGVTDPSAEVRERTLRGVKSVRALWGGNGSNSLVLAALVDDTPALRRLGISLASTRPGFWNRSDASEYLKRLLIDPDPGIRQEALSVVERRQLIRSEPALARRVKVLETDPALARQARQALAIAGIDGASIKADARLGRPRLLSLSTFRQKVNPLFYQTGEDGQSCARCHANHTILRIAESDARISGEDPLIVNYNSALKVVNLGEPESSLLLRKPLSPYGQGGTDPSSPTGLTHVGGRRWNNVEHPAYRAILAWVREASDAAADAGDERHSADSFSPDYEPARAGDGDVNTIWHTEFVGGTPGYPHELVVDLGSARPIEGLLYVPRQDSPNGRVRDFEVCVSQDGKTWGAPVATGRWENDPTFKYVALPTTTARYVALRGLSEVEGRPVMSAAELVVEAAPRRGGIPSQDR